MTPRYVASFFAIITVASACSPSAEAPAPRDTAMDAESDAVVDIAPDTDVPVEAAADNVELPPPPEAEAQLPQPWEVPAGWEGSETTCSNGIDDDGNGYTDCNDRNCSEHPYVWMCATLENGPQTCADGTDNAEVPLGGSPSTDGLVDCDDPDCSKNPYLADVCPSAAPEGYGSGSCGDGKDNDGDGVTDCDDNDCLLAPQSPCDRGGRIRVLFDGTHGQDAGTADWFVDTAVPFPRPSNPELETDWAGRYSFLGLTLVKRRDFVIASLPRGQSLSWQTDGLYDLSRFDVLVLAEPSRRYSADEAQAIGTFITTGGGVMMIGNHAGADRDNNGVDAVTALNELLAGWGPGDVDGNPLGFWFEDVDFEAAQALDAAADSSATHTRPDGHPVLSGPGGTVKRIGMYVGTTIATVENGAAVPLIWPLVPSDPSTGAVVVASQWGLGRVVALADSAIFSDRTDSHGVADGSVTLNQENNLQLALNAFYWSGGR